MNEPLTQAEVNHLRRLVAWVRCEIGQPPEDMVPMVRDIVQRIGGISEDGKAAMVEAHAKSASVPKYIRAAVKALEKTVHRRPDGIENIDPAAEAFVRNVLENDLHQPADDETVRRIARQVQKALPSPVKP